MTIAIFRTRMKPDVNMDEFIALHHRMNEIVSNMPGFVSVKLFRAEDGETLALAEFESLEALNAWRDHPEHVVARQRGLEFFGDYSVKVCSLVREKKSVTAEPARTISPRP
jgi:heme-degrading monooxygenase HmoA